MWLVSLLEEALTIKVHEQYLDRRDTRNIYQLGSNQSLRQVLREKGDRGNLFNQFSAKPQSMQTGNYYKYEEKDGQTVDVFVDYKAWGKQILIWLLICLIVKSLHWKFNFFR